MAVIINNKKVAGVGKPGIPGKSAYELAKQTGYEGSELDLSLALNKVDELSGQIEAHNTNIEAHSDLRDEIATKAPMYSYGTEDLIAGVSPLEAGKLYFRYVARE